MAIAFGLGFSDQSYLDRRFRQSFERTLSQQRADNAQRRIRKGSGNGRSRASECLTDRNLVSDGSSTIDLGDGLEQEELVENR